MVAPFFNHPKPKLQQQTEVLVSFGAEPDSLFLALTAAIFDNLQVSTGRLSDELAKKLIDLHARFFPENANNYVRLLTAKDSLLQQLQKTPSHTLLMEYAFCLRQVLYERVKQSGDYYLPLCLEGKVEIETINRPSTWLDYRFMEAIAEALDIKIKIERRNAEDDLPAVSTYNKDASFIIKLKLTNQHYSALLFTTINYVESYVDAGRISLPKNKDAENTRIESLYSKAEKLILEKFKEEQNRLVMMYKASEMNLDALLDLNTKFQKSESFAGLENGFDSLFNILAAKHPNFFNIKGFNDDNGALAYINAVAKRLALNLVSPTLIYAEEEPLALSPGLN